MFGSIFMLSTEYALMAWQAVYVRVYPHGYDTGLFEWYKKDEAIAALLDKVEAQAGQIEAQAGQIEEKDQQIEEKDQKIEALEAQTQPQLAGASSSAQRAGTPI